MADKQQQQQQPVTVMVSTGAIRQLQRMIAEQMSAVWNVYQGQGLLGDFSASGARSELAAARTIIGEGVTRGIKRGNPALAGERVTSVYHSAVSLLAQFSKRLEAIKVWVEFDQDPGGDLGRYARNRRFTPAEYQAFVVGQLAAFTYIEQLLRPFAATEEVTDEAASSAIEK